MQHFTARDVHLDNKCVMNDLRGPRLLKSKPNTDNKELNTTTLSLIVTCADCRGYWPVSVVLLAVGIRPNQRYTFYDSKNRFCQGTQV